MYFTTTILAALAAASTAFAADAPQYYTLSIKSPINSINGLVLSSKNGRLTSAPNSAGTASSASTTKFSTELYAPTQTYSMHPGSDATHQLALQLQNTGFLALVDLVSPTADSLGGKPTEWSVFTVDPATGEVGVKDGADIPSRKWAAYLDTNGQYYFGLWDGFSRQPRSLANVTIIATKASASNKARRFTA